MQDECPSRRTVKRSVMVIAACVLLVVWYVSSYGVCRYLRGRAVASTFYRLQLEYWEPIIYEPVYVYQWSGMPGDCTLRTFGAWCWCRGRGHSTSWSEIQSNASNGKIVPAF